MDTESLNKINEAVKLIKQGLSILNSGPTSFYINQMMLHSHALLNEFAKFKVGDRVQLTKSFEKDGGGWDGCVHFLTEGATAMVDDVGYDEKGFYYHVVFDRETWIDRYGAEYPVDNKHKFCMREGSLAKCGGSGFTHSPSSDSP